MLDTERFAHGQDYSHPHADQKPAETPTHSTGQAAKPVPKGFMALRLARMGFRVFPLKPNTKEPWEHGWQDRAIALPKEAGSGDSELRKMRRIERWWRENYDYNIGIMCGRGLLVVDYDLKGKNSPVPKEAEQARRAEIMLGEHLEKLQAAGIRPGCVKTPSGGVHLYFKTPPGAKFATKDLRHSLNTAVEIRAEETPITAPGSTIDGVAYEQILRDGAGRLALSPLDNLPFAPDLITDLTEIVTDRPPDADQTSLVPWEDQTLDSPEAKRFCSWLTEEDGALAASHKWNLGYDKTALKICGVGKDFGLSLNTTLECIFATFTKCQEIGLWPGHWRPDYDGPNRFEIKAANAYSYLKQEKPGYRNVEAELGDVTEALAAEQTPETTKQPKPPFEYSFFKDAARLKTKPRYVIKGLIDAESSVLLYGDTNVGKSFVALDLAFHVARGLPYQGRRVRRGLVVYLALEGGAAINARLAALERAYPPEPGETVPLVIITSTFALHKPKEVKALVAFIKDLEAECGEKCQLVIPDTLNRAMPGAQENSADAMSAAQYGIDLIRSEAHAAVLTVHHSGWGGKHARGHSSLPFGADTWLRVEREGNRRVLKDEKQRDGKTGAEHPFRLKEIDLGKDDEGDSIESCIVEWVNEFTEPDELSPAAGEMWEAFQVAAKEATADGAEWQSTVVSTDQWENTLIEMRAGELSCAPNEIRRKKGYSARHLRELRQAVRDSGYVKEIGRGHWAARNAP